MPSTVQWSGVIPMPPLGTRVVIRLNGWNHEPNGAHLDGNIEGTIVGYKEAGGWWHADVLPDSRPAWHVKEYGQSRPRGLFAGNELEVIAKEAWFVVQE